MYKIRIDEIQAVRDDASASLQLISSVDVKSEQDKKAISSAQKRLKRIVEHLEKNFLDIQY